jgi:LysR family glycine cleavage system transcriptional activator
MATRIPPLLWVRVFEAAARHGSFARAGRELCVCAGAVSRIVKELEAFLGVTLFVRRAQGVMITDAGGAYAREVAPAIQQIARASAVAARVAILHQPDQGRESQHANEL